MLRIMTETEKNTSWIPYEKYFMTQDEVKKMLETMKDYDANNITFTREIIMDSETKHEEAVPVKQFDTITISE